MTHAEEFSRPPQAGTTSGDSRHSRCPTAGSNAASAAILAGLAALTLIIAGRDLSVGGFSWSDAPLHAMDGVFLHDLLIQRPEGPLRAWAEQYYLRYQCLGLVVYYPPLFAVIEAVVFLLLGVSVITARVTILLLVIGAVWLVYLFSRELFGTMVGIGSAVLSIATPAGVAWSRQVMLEWPAMFFIMVALVAYRRYLRRPGWPAGIFTAAGCLTAYLTKQTAAFALVLIVVHAWWDYRWGGLFRRSFLVPMAIAMLAIAAYGVATAGHNTLAARLILGSPPFEHLRQVRTWTWYLYRLPTIIGWPVLIVALLAVFTLAVSNVYRYWRQVVSAARDRSLSPDAPAGSSVGEARNGNGCETIPALLSVWLFLWWLVCSVIAVKEERYFFFAVPALAILTAAWLGRWNRQKRAGIGTAALVILCGIQVFSAARTPARRLDNMRPTIDFLVRQADADLVLVDAVRDGQFIFDTRTAPAAGNRVIGMRASKFLYSRAARTRYDYQSHIDTPQQLRAWLDRYGIRYIVIEDRLPETCDPSWDPPPRIMLRETVNNERYFERLYAQPLGGSDPAWRKVNLVTYRYLKAKSRRPGSITVRIPAMGREVTLPLPPTADQPEPD